MPQMFPLNWIMLYFYFITIFMMLIINNFYYSNLFENKNFKGLNNNSNKIQWKW